MKRVFVLLVLDVDDAGDVDDVATNAAGIYRDAIAAGGTELGELVSALNVSGLAALSRVLGTNDPAGAALAYVEAVADALDPAGARLVRHGNPFGPLGPS